MFLPLVDMAVSDDAIVAPESESFD